MPRIEGLFPLSPIYTAGKGIETKLDGIVKNQNNDVLRGRYRHRYRKLINSLFDPDPDFDYPKPASYEFTNRGGSRIRLKVDKDI